MTSTTRVIDPACVAALREPFVLPERVRNTMAEARAPSTRRSEMVRFFFGRNLDLDHLRCVSGSFISAGDAG